jgi:hypothetical protein
VLLAGGAAGIYYTTYAAHYVPRLRVVESAFVGGLLLLALAAAIVWLADRKRSEPLAVLAILLSYYTSAINEIGAFTLFSSLVLTAAAVFFLLRHGWVIVSFLSLAGTYGSYSFWRFHASLEPSTDVTSDSGFGLWFLCGYWVLFTCAVFLGPNERLPVTRRTPFLTLNNAAFFVLAALHVSDRWPGKFWLLSTSFGAVLLGLAAVASRRRSEDKSMDGAYLAQGLALLTAGLAAKLSGDQLALTLAVESALLAGCSRWRQGIIYRIASILAAVGAFALAWFEMSRNPEIIFSLGGSIALLLIFAGWYFKRTRGIVGPGEVSGEAALLVALGLGLAGIVLWSKVVSPWEPAAFAGAAIVCTASIYVLRFTELTILGQGFLAAALIAWVARYGQTAP